MSPSPYITKSARKTYGPLAASVCSLFSAIPLRTQLKRLSDRFVELLRLDISPFRARHARATVHVSRFVSNSGAVRVKIVPSHIWRSISAIPYISFYIGIRDPGLFSPLDKKPAFICLDQSPEAPTSVILQPCLTCLPSPPSPSTNLYACT